MNILSTTIVHLYLRKWGVKLGLLFCFSLLGFSLKASLPVMNDSLNVHIAKEQVAEEKARSWFSTSLYAEFGMPKMDHSYAPLVYDDTFSYGAGISFNFRFVNCFGLQVGASLSSQKTQIGLAKYEDKYTSVDSEGDPYLKIISAKDVTEDQTWLWLNAPVALTYYQSVGKIELYGFGGIEMRHALSANYKQSGIFTHQGYYEEWNILFDDLEDQGFYTDRFMTTEDKLDPDLLIVPFFGIGFLAPGKKSRFYIEARYYLNSNNLFAEQKTSSLFSGPEDNIPVFNFKNESLISYGDVSFGGFKFLLGINF